jgi:hypothetical protein
MAIHSVAHDFASGIGWLVATEIKSANAKMLGKVLASTLGKAPVGKPLMPSIPVACVVQPAAPVVAPAAKPSYLDALRGTPGYNPDTGRVRIRLQPLEPSRLPRGPVAPTVAPPPSIDDIAQQFMRAAMRPQGGSAGPKLPVAKFAPPLPVARFAPPLPVARFAPPRYLGGDIPYLGGGGRQSHENLMPWLIGGGLGSSIGAGLSKEMFDQMTSRRRAG